jgi:hypothetical protein
MLYQLERTAALQKMRKRFGTWCHSIEKAKTESINDRIRAATALAKTCSDQITALVENFTLFKAEVTTKDETQKLWHYARSNDAVLIKEEIVDEFNIQTAQIK